MKECPSCRLCFDDDSNHCPYDNAILLASNKCGITLDKRYVLERRLGKGGMGSVYRAKHVHLKSTHAIKIISPEVVQSDPSLLVRFTQEAILVASIHHPNIVSVTDFGIEIADTLYLVMEYIEGISLDEFLQKEKRLSPAKAYEILKPIALGVGVAHSQGITHRDLKPLNVMLRTGAPLSQAVKVLDFGLAKIKSTESFASLIMAKTTNLLGSPHYMPPEQWDNENVDERSDIYSIGIILFQMLTGDVPFKGNSMPNIMYQHMQAEVPSFASVGISASSRIESVIHKALAKEQDQRFQTVEEFLSAYEHALYDTNDRIAVTPNAKTVSFANEAFRRFEAEPTVEWNRSTDGKSYNLPYLDSSQNERLATYFNQPKPTGAEINENLERQFINAQGRVEEARTKVSQAEKLAVEFNEAQRAAEDARHKFLEAQQKLEEDVRREMKAEMESKLAVERTARQKAEAEAARLAEEAKARQEAEERANQLAKTALEAQHRAQEERRTAEQESRKRQLEEGSRRKAEESIAKLTEEAREAQKRYEEAKRQAEYEAQCRLEAENKRRKVEEEIQRIAAAEAERRKLAEAHAAYKIKEQASRLESEALDAQNRADEARRLAESEARKRENAEAAQRKAETEARRLAEEIIGAQKRLEEAEQRARSEAEKRASEEAARKKAEESARSSSLENQQNFETIQQNLLSQLAEARLLAKTEAEKRALEEAARKRAEESARSLSEAQKSALFGDAGYRDSSPNLAGRTQSGIDLLSSGQRLADTTGTAASNTDRIRLNRAFNPVYLVSGLLGFFLLAGTGAFLLFYASGPASPPDTLNAQNSNDTRETSQTSVAEPPERLKNRMVLIKGGAFLMGRDDADPSDERMYGSQYPAHGVTVEDFYLDRTEVTNDEYAEFVKVKGVKAPGSWEKGSPPAGRGNFPVTEVSYFDARNFADWMSSKAGIPCRLPTEQEWEFAARSGSSQYIFPWGNEWKPDRVNFATGSPTEAGTSTDETAAGVKDLMGSVLEWTSSQFEYYSNFPPAKKEPTSGKITVRGVSFTKEGLASLQKTELLLTLRQAVSPDKKFDFLGFRLACNVPRP